MDVEDFHTLCLVRNNRNKIISDNSHIMTVNGKLLYTLRASIDQPKTMLFAGRELEAGCSSVVLAGSSTTVTLLVYAQAISSKTQNLTLGKCYGRRFLRKKSEGGHTRQAPHLSS
jgi:hypothetical protein